MSESERVDLEGLTGLSLESIDGGNGGSEDPSITLEGGVTVTFIHGCCGCCDWGYTIEVERPK
jgi:hypothetical protein